MEKWRADGGEEKLKAAKKAAKRAEKAASSPKKKAGGGKSSFTNSTKISLHFPIYTMYLRVTTIGATLEFQPEHLGTFRH